MTEPSRASVQLARPRRSASQVRRRWGCLAVLAVAQLMVVLDTTIMNIALPSAQQDLGFATADRQGVITAYGVTFGSLLLVGGRISDRLGRRRALIIGLVGFALASALGGAAVSFEMLVGGRALQGVFGALLAPSVLSLVATLFPSGRPRLRAFGVIGLVASSGTAIGLILGGFLTEFVDWRWTMYVNVVFAAGAVVGARLLLPDVTPLAHRGVDLLGAALALSGIGALVFGCAQAEGRGWVSLDVLGPVLGGVAAVLGFVVWQRFSRSPLLPLRVVRDRDRSAAYLCRFMISVGNYAVLFFMSFLLQRNLGLGPLLTGLAIAPMVVGFFGGSRIVTSAVAGRLRFRSFAAIGLLLVAASLAWLSRIELETSYWSGIVWPMVLFGIGQAIATTATMSAATDRLDADDMGVGSAMLNVTQQLGGALGTAVLSGVAASVTRTERSVSSVTVTEASTHGITAAFLCAAVLFAASALTCTLLATGRSGDSSGDSHPRRSPVINTLNFRLRGLAATLVLIGFLVGVPTVLLVVAVPDPTSMSWARLTARDDGTPVAEVLAAVCWIAWVVFTCQLAASLAAQVRGIHTRRMPGLAVPQLAADRLVAAAALLFVAMPSRPASFHSRGPRPP